MLCARCKGKLLCRAKFCPILQRVRHWKRKVEGLKHFQGITPPSLFVGRQSYPNVWVGVLSSPDASEQLDFPELWYRQHASIEDVLNYRAQLIYSRQRSHAKQVVEAVRLIAPAKEAVSIEVELKRKPAFKFSFEPWALPVGNPAPLQRIQITENVKVERKVEAVLSDQSLKAQEAVVELFEKGIPVSRIQKIFSAGLLGKSLERKLVPTRWSITAVDDAIGRHLLRRVVQLPWLEEVKLYCNEYVGNIYHVLLLPNAYCYELIEIKYPKSVWNLTEEPIVYSDYELHWGKSEYAADTGGAFYAGRLAILEHMLRISRQAAVLLIREVTNQFYAPIGIWQMREAVRDCFNKPCLRFENLEQALQELRKRVPQGLWLHRSKLIKHLLSQRLLLS